MSIDPLAFLDEPSSPAENHESNDPLSFLEEPQSNIRLPGIGTEKRYSEENKIPQMQRQLKRDAVTSATGVAGLPGDLASIFTGKNALDSSSLREKAFELFPSLSPQSEKEKEWDEGLSTIAGLVTPIGAPFKFAAKGLGKLIPASLRSKSKELFALGKELGIDEKALAPFRHGKITGKILQTLGKLGETAKSGIRFAENLATSKYQELFAQGSKIPLNMIAKKGVVRNLENIVSEIEKSPALVKESKDVISFLREAIENLKNNPQATVENLMALQKEMGKSVNWSSIKKSGKGHLVQKARAGVEQGIYAMSPKLGHEFTSMDKLVHGYKKLGEAVSPLKFKNLINYGGPAGVALASLMTGKSLSESATRAIETYFGKKALGYISGKLLTSPRWVGIKEKIINVIKNESYDKIPKLMVALKKKSEMED